MVVPGFREPRNFVGQDQVFVASYDLEDPDRPRTGRLTVLEDQARRHMAEWQAQV